jgi:hypothetical protein
MFIEILPLVAAGEELALQAAGGYITFITI